MKPKLLLLTTDFPPDIGGIQAALYNTALAFNRFDVAVIAPGHPEAGAFDRAQPFEIHRVKPERPRSRLDRIRRMSNLALATATVIRRDAPDAILCGHPFTSGIGLLARKATGVPYVVWTHAMELLAWGPMLRRSLPAADAVLVISGHTRSLAASLGVSQDRMVLIPYAPDCSPVTAGAPENNEGPIVLTVSRLDELYKGHDVLMRALPLIAGRHPDVRWVIVGDGSLRRHYERLAESRGVADRVLFTGAISREQRDRWFQRCTVFALISRDRAIDGGGEGFGLVFLEAGAFGKAVVAGRAGGSLEAVVDGSTGLLVDAENEVEVADAVIRLLDDPALADRLGRAGQARVQDQFSWRRTAAAIEDVLLKAIDKQS